jgi:hypothetical protein
MRRTIAGAQSGVGSSTHIRTLNVQEPLHATSFTVVAEETISSGPSTSNPT